MARIIDGEIIGKMGNLVRYKSDNKFYLRKAPQRTKPFSEGELKNQYIFRLVQEWVSPLKEVLKVGFNGYSPTVKGVNAAVSLIHKEALHRDGYDSYIDPEKVWISFGTLGLPAEIEVALQEGNLHFSWDTGIDEQKDPRDRVLLLAYNPATFDARYNLSGPKRYMGTASLALEYPAPGNYHIYLAFIAANGKRQSMSRYLGMYTIS